jgi:hypothetical protein
MKLFKSPRKPMSLKLGRKILVLSLTVNLIHAGIDYGFISAAAHNRFFYTFDGSFGNIVKSDIANPPTALLSMAPKQVEQAEKIATQANAPAPPRKPPVPTNG